LLPSRKGVEAAAPLTVLSTLERHYTTSWHRRKDYRGSYEPLSFGLTFKLSSPGKVLHALLPAAKQTMPVPVAANC